MTHYYRFDQSDIQGTLVLNYATNTYDGLLVNGATISTTSDSFKGGDGGLYLASTGVASTSPYFDISDGIVLGESGLTFAIWFKSSSSGDWARIMEFGNGSPSDTIDVTVSMSGTNRLAYEVQPGGSGYGNEIDSGLTVNDNTWRHFAWTISTDGTWKLYINGALSGTDTGQPVPAYVYRTNAWLGKSEWGDAPFNGWMDEFRIYKSVLGSSDITALYSSTAPGITTTITTTNKLPYLPL